MTEILAIISKAVFEADSKGARPGDVLPLDRYTSTNKALEPLRAGGRLFLVTVRPPDERLWLVAVLEAPRFDGKAWIAPKNTHPITDLTAQRGKIRFTSNSGISLTKGALGMSLQTPRQLTAADVALLGHGSSKPSSPTRAVLPTRAVAAEEPRAAAPEARFESIVNGRLEQALVAVRELSRTADASVVPSILPWVNLEKWRATEATAFWVYTYFLLMRFGDPSHVPFLQRLPKHKDYSVMHSWVRNNCALVVDVIRLRQQPRAKVWAEEPLPRTRARVTAHIDARLGDPRWKPTSALVELILKPPFSLEGEEGLRVFAALLLHGEPSLLAPLKSVAAREPMVAQLLAAHGVTSGAAGDTGALGDRLRQAVLDAPADDQRRAVYADWLVEQGDARGEFMSNQLAGHALEPDSKLALAWAGDVGTELRWRPRFKADAAFHIPRYRRGFLAGALISGFQGGAAASRDWATLEVIDLESSSVAAMARIADYDLRSLLVLGGLHDRQLTALAAHRPLAEQLEGLGVGASRPGPEVWDQLLAFPRLRVLAVSARGSLTSFYEHPIARQLEFLVVPRGSKVPASLKAQVVRPSENLFVERWLPHFDRLTEVLSSKRG